MSDSQKILLVDDSKLSRISLSRMLSDFNGTLSEASDGFEALEKINELKPDLVFLDLLMPNLDGIGVLEKLKEDGVSVPVVIVSADIQNTTRDLCFKLGAVDFVNKPMEQEHINSILYKYIRT